MEEAIPNASLTKQIHDPHMHHIPESQSHADFVMEHLNNPNFDLSHLPPLTSSIEKELRFGQDGNEEIYFEESDLF